MFYASRQTQSLRENSQIDTTDSRTINGTAASASHEPVEVQSVILFFHLAKCWAESLVLLYTLCQVLLACPCELYPTSQYVQEQHSFGPIDERPGRSLEISTN